MAPVTLDLGALDLTSTSSSLNLRLSSTAHFATSEKDDEFPERWLTTATLTSEAPDRPWIAKSNDFRVVIGVDFDGVGDEMERRGLLDMAAQKLNEAELWRHLHLRSTGTRLQAQEHGTTGVITIHLAHEDDKTTQPRHRQHKLASDVPSHDVRPPPGVQSAQLDSVELRMQFSPNHTSKRRRLDPSSHRTSSNNTSAMRLANDILVEQELCNRAIATHPLTTPRSQTDPGLSFHAGDDDHALGLESEPTSAGKTHLQKRSRSSGDLEMSGRQADFSHGFCELFDAALRTAISSQRRMPKGVRLASSESFKHLADVIPTLWMPHCLSTMSSRSVLLPTISLVLSDICGTHARSSRLTSKFEELERRASFILNDHAPQPQRHSSTVPILLWHAMQRSLQNSEAGKTLGPLSTDVAGYLHDDLEILDCASEDFRPRVKSTSIDSDADDSILDFELAQPDDLYEHHVLASDASFSSDESELLSICGSVASLTCAADPEGLTTEMKDDPHLKTGDPQETWDLAEDEMLDI